MRDMFGIFFIIMLFSALPVLGMGLDGNISKCYITHEQAPDGPGYFLKGERGILRKDLPLGGPFRSNEDARRFAEEMSCPLFKK